MAQPSQQRNIDRDVLARLQDELEQSRVSLEDAQNEIAVLAAENGRLTDAVASLDAKRSVAEVNAARLRMDVARSAELIAKSRHNAVDDQELHTALEEASLMAEELRETNDALLAANSELGQRVADRTRDVEQANAKLERLNAELRAQVDAETAARSKAQADLFQMQKLDAIGQLTGGIAHDFNNLLTVITSGLQLLSRPRNEEQRDRVLHRIQDAAWRGAQLTQRLLAFARRQPLHPERVDLLFQMDSIRSLLSHTLRENIEMQVKVEPGTWPVEADVAALELAMLNIAVNARDAMPEGGKLLLAARNDPLPAGGRGRLDLAPGDYVRISLIDTGVGMAPDMVEKVFEPFFSTKPQGKGTGLGLAQVYGFARQSDGAALLESTLGKGTQVHILLPRSHRPKPAAERPPGDQRAPRREIGHLKVLVVEDDDSVAATVAEMLEELGHTSTRVVTVASALATLTSGNNFHLVFSDVLLPGGGSGLDLAREMNRQSIAVPMVLTSGFGGGMTQRLAAANLPFLRKPYKIEALHEAIDAAMQQLPAIVEKDRRQLPEAAGRR